MSSHTNPELTNNEENKMKDIKFELTAETKVNAWGVTLFRIKAKVDITNRGVKKGELGGFVESTHLNNGDARVSGNAWVSGDAQVSGNAWVSLKKAYTQGNFLSSSDRTITPVIINQTKEDGFNGGRDYKNLLVIGDYKIEDIDPPEEAEKPASINIGGKEYQVTDELTKALKDLKEIES